MSIFKKLVFNNLKLNKNRTIGTIIGIVLSVALVCGVLCIVTSFRTSLLKSEININGYYHIYLNNINNNQLEKLKLNNDIKDINPIYNYGYSKIDYNASEDEKYLTIYSIDNKTFDNLSFEIIEGKFPNNENEIIINNKVAYLGEYKVGDYLELNVGDINIQSTNGTVNYDLKNVKNKKFKIVGIMNKSSVSHVNMIFTTNLESDVVDCYISFKKPSDYKNSVKELLNIINNVDDHVKLDDSGYYINEGLLDYEVLSFSYNNTMTLIKISLVVIFIIIIVSVFCIRNSFLISTTEKMKMYGMLASVGATKKQIKKTVILEGFILGIIAIPIGILAGFLGVFLLVKIINVLSINSSLIFYYDVSFISILISILLGFITIYFSSISSSKKASKVSPIDNLKNLNSININSKSLKCPKVVKNIFKTGGVIAYKNLKRSKKKYRTTIISLTISIFVFISLSSFVTQTKTEVSNFYTEYDYNFKVSLNDKINLNKDVLNINKMMNVNNSYLVYISYDSIIINDLSKVNNMNNSYLDDNTYLYLDIVLVDDDTFKDYTKKIGINYDDVKEQGILFNKTKFYDDDENKYKNIEIYNYKKGDIINSTLNISSNKINVMIGEVTDISVYGFEGTYNDNGYIVLNKKYFSDIDFRYGELLIETDDNVNLMKEIYEYNNQLEIVDFDAVVKEQNNKIIIIEIFLYGFICVITLIGVTNIFNTITSNMQLRQGEFAVLKSVGMTNKEFNRIINLETIFYCFKSLFYGIILGIIGSYLIYYAFNNSFDSEFRVSFKAILISVIFVFIIVYIIMKYSIKKFNRKNIIETIRNENI